MPDSEASAPIRLYGADETSVPPEFQTYALVIKSLVRVQDPSVSEENTTGLVGE